MKRFYRKEIVSNSFIVEGAAVPFEILDGNRGLIILDSETDAKLVSALDDAANKGRGGIVRINEQEYENQKKTPLPKPSNLPNRLSEPIRVMPHDLSPHPKAAAVAAANGKSAGAAPDPNIGADGLRLDGPTLEEFVATGFPPAGYPPRGYAIRTVPRWKEAGLKAPPKDEGFSVDKTLHDRYVSGIPSPDPVIAKEQGQGSAEADKMPSNKTPEPTKPAFKPATKRLGQEKAKENLADKTEKPIEPPKPPSKPLETTA